MHGYCSGATRRENRSLGYLGDYLFPVVRLMSNLALQVFHALKWIDAEWFSILRVTKYVLQLNVVSSIGLLVQIHWIKKRVCFCCFQTRSWNHNLLKMNCCVYHSHTVDCMTMPLLYDYACIFVSSIEWNIQYEVDSRHFVSHRPVGMKWWDQSEIKAPRQTRKDHPLDLGTGSEP